MVLALSHAVKIDIGIIAIFGVLFPLLVHALIGLAAGDAYGEKQDNEEYRRTRRIPGSKV